MTLSTRLTPPPPQPASPAWDALRFRCRLQIRNSKTFKRERDWRNNGNGSRESGPCHFNKSVTLPKRGDPRSASWSRGLPTTLSSSVTECPDESVQWWISVQLTTNHTQTDNAEWSEPSTEGVSTLEWKKRTLRCRVWHRPNDSSSPFVLYD